MSRLTVTTQRNSNIEVRHFVTKGKEAECVSLNSHQCIADAVREHDKILASIPDDGDTHHVIVTQELVFTCVSAS